jgi:hypothetical protein
LMWRCAGSNRARPGTLYRVSTTRRGARVGERVSLDANTSRPEDDSSAKP